MSGMSKVLHSQLNKDTSVNHDYIFGQMRAAELKTFSELIKFRVTHEINNVIFNFKAQEFQSCSLLSFSSSASANQEDFVSIKISVQVVKALNKSLCSTNVI